MYVVCRHVCQLSMYCAAPEREAERQTLHYTLLGANISKSLKCQLVTRKKQSYRNTVSDTITSVTVPHRHSALSTKTAPNTVNITTDVHVTPLNIAALQGHLQGERILLVVISEVIIRCHFSRHIY